MDDCFALDARNGNQLPNIIYTKINHTIAKANVLIVLPIFISIRDFLIWILKELKKRHGQGIGEKNIRAKPTDDEDKKTRNLIDAMILKDISELLFLNTIRCFYPRMVFAQFAEIQKQLNERGS